MAGMSVATFNSTRDKVVPNIINTKDSNENTVWMKNDKKMDVSCAHSKEMTFSRLEQTYKRVSRIVEMEKGPIDRPK